MATPQLWFKDIDGFIFNVFYQFKDLVGFKNMPAEGSSQSMAGCTFMSGNHWYDGGICYTVMSMPHWTHPARGRTVMAKMRKLGSTLRLPNLSHYQQGPAGYCHHAQKRASAQRAIFHGMHTGFLPIHCCKVKATFAQERGCPKHSCPRDHHQKYCDGNYGADFLVHALAFGIPLHSWSFTTPKT